MRETLDLTLTLDAGHERAAALQARARMAEPQWKILVEFAAEVVAVQESVSQGHSVLVLPAGEKLAEAVVRALGRGRTVL